MVSANFFPEFVLGHPKDARKDPHHVPKDKKPKSRPPNSIRDNIPFYGHLPKYSGPYEVGVIDLEIPVREPRHFSNIKRRHRHALVLETVLITLYYPAHVDCGNDESIRRAKSKHNARPTWLSRPRRLTAKGYGKSASLPQWPTMLWFAVTTMLTKLPAYRNCRLAQHWPDANQSWHDRKGYSTAAPPPPEGPEQPIFPLILFSHGLDGNRLCYSSMCGEFASHGFIVCAVEHRDGSGPRTVVNVPQDSIRKMASEALAKERHNVKPRDDHAWEIVDFLVPQYDKYDTIPTHEIDQELRASQIQLRLAEIDEAYYLMQELCAGRGNEIAQTNVRIVGTPGASSLGLDGVDFDMFKGRFHCDNVTMMGHSFGSATTVEMLRSHDKYNYVTQSIVYDIWGSPVKEADPDHRIDVPLLGINSEAFMYWEDNFRIAKHVIEESESSGHDAWLMTVRGTVHISQSDFCILYPRIASYVMKATADPIRAIDVNIDASLDFLDRTLKTDDEQAFRRNLPQKKLLDIDVVDAMPTEHKPKARWTAMRLRIKHEGRKRLTPYYKEWYRRKLRQLGEEEVWVHYAPGKHPVGMECCGKKGPEDDESEWQDIDDKSAIK